MAKRFSKSDWIAVGLRQLGKIGPSALTIDALCEETGKTRGSFYFHFESIDGFLETLVSEWHQRFTSEIVAGSPSTLNRLDLLNLLAGRLDLALETGMRQLAQINLPVADIVSLADRKRIDWLASLYIKSGAYNADDADELASIEYAAFIGFKLVEPDLSPARARKLYEAFCRFTDRG